MDRETTISISPEGTLSPFSTRPVANVPQAIPTSARVVRTFERDVAEAMRENKGSVVSVALAEKRKRETEEATTASASKKKTVIIAAIGVVAFGGIAFGIYRYMSAPAATPEAISHIPRPLIFVEKRTAVRADGFTQPKLVAAAKQEENDSSLRLDTIKEVYFTRGLGDATQKLPTGEFFRILGSRIPSVLLRSLGEDFMFGVHAFNGNQSFLILKTDFYENAFLGLLNWERNMSEDLFPFFGILITDENRYLLDQNFEDRVIKNQDTRVLLDQAGKIVLMYAFPERDTIVISTGEDTFTEVLNRLHAPQTNIPQTSN